MIPSPRGVVAVAVLSLVGSLSLAAQDVVTIGTVTASGSSVDVPVYIRDTSGTPLGVDRPAGSKIQSYSIKVTYPAASVTSVTFSRAGITSNLTPTSEFSPSTSGSISLLDTFQESTNPIPFGSNAPAPGNLVAHLVFQLSSSVVPGSSIPLTLDTSLTQLTDDGGNSATVETSTNGQLALVNGAINIPGLSVTLTPSPLQITAGGNAQMTVTTSSTVSSNTTVALTSSVPAVATVPASVVITAGSNSATFTVDGLAAGTSIITAALPNGGATTTAEVDVNAACGTMPAPVLTGPTSSAAGVPYTITWVAVTGATNYVIEESADANFSAVTTTNSSTPSATFSHTSGTFRYRVRAYGTVGACGNLTSANSNTVTVSITSAGTVLTNVIPVVGSLPGSFGSFFRTSVQLYNPRSSSVSGRIVFHPQGGSGSAGDPAYAYALAPRKTLAITDLLPLMGTSGIGSADVVSDTGSALPLVVSRLYNDGGPAGTSGLTEDALKPEEALQTGDSGSLVVPTDFTRFRLNVGVRTLTAGATLAITVTDKDGSVVKTLSRPYDPTYFLQTSAAGFLDNFALVGGETITVQVTAGSAFVYGATTDNISQDPNIQFARKQ
jgi:hypothetical protein